MSHSDSMFLFEIVVEGLKSYVDCKEFYIRNQFADVFILNLKDPNELATLLPKPKKRKKLKTTVRNGQSPIKKAPPEGKVQSGQSVLFASSIDTLILNMKRFPMELSLWSKDDTVNRLGSTHIPWSLNYIEYLHKITIKQNPAPAFASGEYSVFDEYTSRRMASIKLNIKLTYLKDKITTSFRSLSEDNQNTFVYTGFNSKATTIMSTIKSAPEDLMEKTGIIKTIYSGGKRKFKSSNRDKSKPEIKIEVPIDEIKQYAPYEEPDVEDEEVIDFIDGPDEDRIVNQSIVSMVKSDSDLDRNRKIEVIKTQSCTSVNQEHPNIFNYIFGNSNGPYGNQVYCVGYCSVENDLVNSPTTSPSSKNTPTTSPSSKASVKASSERTNTPKLSCCKRKICECPSSAGQSDTQSEISLDTPEDSASFSKCKQVYCDNRQHQIVPEPPDERVLIDMTNLNRTCCDNVRTVEEVAGGMTAKMKINKTDKCYCECECTFGFVKKTTYCGVCGGYEKAGEDFSRKPPNAPFPCPIYHKMVDKNKLKSWSTSGSDTKKKADDSQRNLKASPKSIGKSDKSIESEKDSKKGKKKKKDDRFKFNYGYSAPQIGHSQCAMPCTGTLGAVPKNMGWLWTSEDVPGIKFRPLWKPGATNKHVVRLLRMAKNPGQVITKKKRKDAGKKKSLKRPLLVIHKKDGEYTVTMETMKPFLKPRFVNQYPYEDKPLVTYTIGRTEEENLERRKKKEREQRRIEREQRNFIQSAFQDMCNEICLKTYQQALGILPGAEDPDCPCYPAHPGADKTNLDVSCSCSEDKSFSAGSDTDDDEWIVEFTPPNATFDPTFKSKKVLKVDNTSQYTYLDYRVKLLDRFGNPIPRIFKGPDGRNQCSDLGGFWSPEHKWLEINSDGYIAPDGRWAPMNFIGPNGEHIDCDNGKFQTANAKWLVVGIDGYVDSQGKWKFYPRPRGVAPEKKPREKGGTSKKGAGDKEEKAPYKPTEASWSCFGDATPVQLSKMGIVGHGYDKKILLATLKEMQAHGEDVRLPQPSTVPRLPPPKKGKKRTVLSPRAIEELFMERVKCRHPVPSDKGIVAVDDQGTKAYFKMKDYKNRRPKDRMANLVSQGISLSSFHMPCFHSFLNTEMLKQQQYEKATGKCVSTQVG